MALKGIDISEWQEKIDFKKVKEDGIQFCIIRQGYRKTIDKYFLTNVKGAQQNNIPIHGVYHFCYAVNQKETINEAKSCIKNIEKAGLGKDIIIFFDFEYDTVDKAKAKGVTLSKKECIAFTKAFCDYVLSQGYHTGVYTNLDYYYNMYDKDTINKYENFWLAEYNNGKEPSIECIYHQYSSKGKVNGINGYTDMNYYYGIVIEEEDLQPDILDDGSSKDVDVTFDFSKYYGEISNSGHDENGSYKNGIAGDNTGTEWEIRVWYNRPWDCILRYPDEKVGNLIAELGIEAANNNLIGYDQWQRDTYWQHLQASNYRPSQITVACEADCSAGVIANVKAVGYLLNIDALKNINATYTGNMKNSFKAAGFQVLTDSKYLNSYDYLKPGDILLNEIHHTATNLGIGTKSNYSNSNNTNTNNTNTNNGSPNKTPVAKGKVTASALYVRKWAGTENAPLNSIPLIYKGKIVDICDTVKDRNGNDWYYIKIDNSIYGFASAAYIQKI